MAKLLHRVGTLLSAGGLALLAAACQDKEVDPKQVVYNGPLSVTENVVTMLSDSARPHIRLTAPLEERFENNDVRYRKSVAVTFYDKPGQLVVNTIQAKWAKYENSKQLYILRGDVRVANLPQQQKLNTEELFYDRGKQKIYTDSSMYVRVETPTEVLTGYGLTANQDFSRYGIRRPTGIFTLEEAKTLGK